MSQIDEYRTFVAVADGGSFVSAADKLGSSKAAASRHVAQLEQRLGVRLLHRTTRRLSLTDEGRVFVDRCRELLNDIEEAEAEITARRANPSGTLRANVALTFGIRYLAPVWGEFRARHPKVSLDVTLSDRIVDLLEEGFDLSVRITSKPPDTLIARRLATTRLAVCAAPKYFSKHGTPKQPHELRPHVIASYANLAGGDTWRFTGPDGDAEVATTPTYRTNSGDTCRELAIAGHALVMQPTFLVSEDLAHGRLVEALRDYRTPELGVYALYASRRHVTPRVRAMVDFLAKWFATPRWKN